MINAKKIFRLFKRYTRADILERDFDLLCLYNNGEGFVQGPDGKKKFEWHDFKKALSIFKDKLREIDSDSNISVPSDI